MPHHLFGVFAGVLSTTDAIGVNLADDDRAGNEAVLLLADIARDERPDRDEPSLSLHGRRRQGGC